MNCKFDFNWFAFKYLISDRNDRKVRFSETPSSFNYTSFSEVLFCCKRSQNARNQTTSNVIFPKKQTIVSGISTDTSFNYSYESPRFLSLGSHHSSLGGHHSNLGSDHSNLGSHHSNLGSHHSNLGSHHSNLGSHHSNLGGDHSNLGSDHSNLGSHHSNLGSDHSNLGSHHSNLGSDHSNLGSHHSSLGGHHSSWCSDSSNFKIGWFAFSKDIFIYINTAIILSKQMLRCYALHFHFTAACP